MFGPFSHLNGRRLSQSQVSHFGFIWLRFIAPRTRQPWQFQDGSQMGNLPDCWPHKPFKPEKEMGFVRADPDISRGRTVTHSLNVKHFPGTVLANIMILVLQLGQNRMEARIVGVCLGSFRREVGNVVLKI